MIEWFFLGYILYYYMAQTLKQLDQGSWVFQYVRLSCRLLYLCPESQLRHGDLTRSASAGTAHVPDHANPHHIPPGFLRPPSGG